jgi:hypothetical protein
MDSREVRPYGCAGDTALSVKIAQIIADRFDRGREGVSGCPAKRGESSLFVSIAFRSGYGVHLG